MKFYLITIIAVMVFTAGTATAQNINIGLKGGLNSYNIENEDNSAFDPRMGFQIGLLGHMHLNEQFAFQPELVYSLQGAKSSSTDIRLDYMNIPLLLQYMFDNGFRVQTGPQLGFLIDAEAENGSSMDVGDEFKSIDLGLSIGASYVHSSTGFGIDARYNLGLTDISENSNEKLTNRGLQIGVFYLFNYRN